MYLAIPLAATTTRGTKTAINVVQREFTCRRVLDRRTWMVAGESDFPKLGADGQAKFDWVAATSDGLGSHFPAGGASDASAEV